MSTTESPTPELQPEPAEDERDERIVTEEEGTEEAPKE